MKRLFEFKLLVILLAGIVSTPAISQNVSEIWKGPKQYIVLSTADGFDGSIKNGKAKPNPYKMISETYGSFEGKSVAIGVAPMFRVFQRDMNIFTEELRNHLKQSEQFKVPVFICLSSFVFNNARPDMWNWWDKNAPGYNPANKYNVEWYDWTPDSAVKIGWLNWGSQMRLPPMPNLMSQGFKKELKIAFSILGLIIKEWHDNLPENEKWLLIGLRSTDEVAIGINNWYYPDGNSYLGRDPEDDPQTGLQPLILPSRGVQTIGYAAVRTAGIKNSGTITIEDINEACRRHCEYSSKLLFDLGIPREKIFSSSFGKTEGECKTCVTQYSCPSWSFYHANAITPSGFVAAFQALEYSDAPYWAMAEWGIPKDSEADRYQSGLETALKLPKCRFVRLTGEFFDPPLRGTPAALIDVLKLLTN